MEDTKEHKVLQSLSPLLDAFDMLKRAIKKQRHQHEALFEDMKRQCDYTWQNYDYYQVRKWGQWAYVHHLYSSNVRYGPFTNDRCVLCDEPSVLICSCMYQMYIDYVTQKRKEEEDKKHEADLAQSSANACPTVLTLPKSSENTCSPGTDHSMPTESPRQAPPHPGT